MGLVNVVESNISETSEWFWNKVGPVVPNISLDTSAYNQHFVKLMMVAGVLTLGHLTVSGVKAVSKIKCHKPPTKEQIQSKYGKNAWALVVDVARNQKYCQYLASKGINLILMGEQEDIKITRDMVNFDNHDVRIEEAPINWDNRNINYEEIMKQFEDFDIAFLIMPQMEVSAPEGATHTQPIPPFEHYYLMFRHFGPKLRWRSYTSAVILPSNKKVDQIIPGDGVRQGIRSALDSWMRAMNFENKNELEIIVNRGGKIQGCFAALGKEVVYQ